MSIGAALDLCERVLTVRCGAGNTTGEGTVAFGLFEVRREGKCQTCSVPIRHFNAI